MTPLIAVVVTVGALVLAFAQTVRKLWARSRSVERHRHTLGALAGITSNPDARERPPSTEGAHQAHVRVIVPEGNPQPGNAQLSPPLAFPGVQANASPFRKPSRQAPSVAAMDAVATAGTSAPGAQVVRTGPTPPVTRPSLRPGPNVPSSGRPGGPAGAGAGAGVGRGRAGELAGTSVGPVHDEPLAEEVTLTSFTPPPPPPPAAPPTRPVPIARPHVFYFDDVSRYVPAHTKTRPGGAAPGESSGAVPGEGAALGEGAVPGEGAAFVATPSGGRARPDALTTPFPVERRRKVAVAGRLAAAAVVVIAAAVSVTLLAGRPSHHLATPPPTAPRRPASHQTSHRALGSHPATPATTPATTPPTTAPAPSVGTVPSRPAKAAVFLSVSAGTATYQLTARSASIVVKASGPCWIEVRAGSPRGQVIYESTLGKGQEASVTGPAWIRLGDPPYAAVTVNGSQLRVPGESDAVPLNLQFTVG